MPPRRVHGVARQQVGDAAPMTAEQPVEQHRASLAGVGAGWKLGIRQESQPQPPGAAPARFGVVAAVGVFQRLGGAGFQQGEVVRQSRRQIGALGQGVEAGVDAQEIALGGGFQQIGTLRQAGDQIHHVYKQRGRRHGDGVIGPGGVGQGVGVRAAFQFGQRCAHGVGRGRQVWVGLQRTANIGQRLGVVASQRSRGLVQKPGRRRRAGRRFGRRACRGRHARLGRKSGARRPESGRPPERQPAPERATPAGVVGLSGDHRGHGFRHKTRRCDAEAAPGIRLAQQRGDDSRIASPRRLQ